jgi:hypothetical protein
MQQLCEAPQALKQWATSMRQKALRSVNDKYQQFLGQQSPLIFGGKKNFLIEFSSIIPA